MLTFLRKLRRSVLQSGKVRTYLSYAIGEIFLVVIGILIALEINNWNQGLIENRKEKLLLEEIHSEFRFNKRELEDNRGQYRRVLGKCEKIIEYFPIDLERFPLDSLAYYLRRIDFNGSFDMSNGSIQALKNTYSFEIISDQELRTLLILIDNQVSDYAEREARSIEFVEQFFKPYLHDKVPFPISEGIMDERIDPAFLQTIHFENLIRERAEKIRVFLGLIENENRPLVRSIDRIVELSTAAP